ncbi:hypothetical protein BDS110ZK4_25140 [Bradyrhizobium diazoefficiens]|uniref:Uncharacterized protein n=1 Tax=Bradyrhizobium diazoefficiens TaxID=1355477 RepID=A0A809Z882_9BRAD|nr:hypothetical protein XF1B_50810 [Bradyrhizobium diazoefficiens]BCE48664.1 hypothetical protein XF4B_50130 [Bradyrhizobium diazoefficiens]BCE92180.1 hypothetical protein XF10B_49780 [Bradyrhizobium diazoefficiens]BCF27107.1 hypothetical protein XF14B_50590 [Bradyrhizobium diazoefficiens]
MRSPSQKLGDILPLGQRVCIFRIDSSWTLSYAPRSEGVGVSQFLSTLLLVTAVVLTVCFGVAAWRLSDEKDLDVTGRIPRQSYGWKQPSRN